jgi:hypothetical protein
MVKGNDIDVPKVSHVVTAREIGVLFRFACFYPYFRVGYRDFNPKLL